MAVDNEVESKAAVTTTAEQPTPAPHAHAHGHDEFHHIPKVDDAAEAAKLGVSVDEVVVNRISEEELLRVGAESLNIWSRTGWRLFLIIIVMGCNSAGYGIDWAIIGNVNSYDRWHTFFGFGNTGPVIGTINALMTIGGVVGAPFYALADVIGRRGINFLGNAIVVVAAILQCFSPNLPAFIVGRFLLGFGTAICSSPQYVAEVAPAHLRGRMVGIYGTCFQIGSLGMSGVMLGFTHVDSDWQWRIPLLLQGLFPLIVCITIYWWCPETPRYLVLKGKREQARAVVAAYNTTDNDVNAPIVDMVMAQMEESIETSAAGPVRASYDYRVFFTKAVWFRTMLLLIYSIFQQWNGGGIIGYYMAPALETIGITDPSSQIGINMGLTAIYFVFMGVGSYLIDVMRRRTMIFAGLISFVIAQTAVTITSWQYSLNPTSAAAGLTITWVFLFQVCSASLIANMHNLYPVELLSLPLRAKGMGLYALFQSAAGVVMGYGISIGIGELGYKIWVVFIVYNALQLIIAYFLFPETGKLSLEEIDSIFETPGANPVKLSLKIEKGRKERDSAERAGLVSNA